MLPQATVIDMSMTEEQVEKIATRAATQALANLFEIFGADVTTPEGRKAIAEDFTFIRTARVGSSRFKTVTVSTLATSIVTGLCWVIYKGLMAIGIVVVR